ncbi:MAG: C1 family peptidase [Erysipelotrichaceae bacterium]|jgi:bleomycin hydrolase|nr:C1 family peptidase [Erysipelotrichaceae bacterium]
MKEISEKELAGMADAYRRNEKARVVRNALTKNDISTISRVFEAEAANPNIFSIDNKTMTATNQKQSGRCWIFSSMNVLREIIAKRFKIKDFELSQNYIAFYDKLEKANWFMECTLQELDQPITSENMRFLLEWAVGDGGQWNMLQSIVMKYGICPKSAMPETYQSSHTRNMNGVLNLRLRKFAADSRRLAAEGKKKEIASLKKEALSEIYGLLASCFGMPPVEFTFEYRDKDDKHHADYHVKPLDFYHQYLKTDLEDYVCVINGPTEDKPFYKTYSVKYLGNVVGGHKIELLNLPIKEFKKAALDQLKAGELVWFGCDCSKDADRALGLWDDAQYDYANTFDMQLDLTKAEALDTRESAMNHAMVLTGVNLNEKGQPDRWKIENSWGEEIANKGFFIASDTWFDKYMYVVAINKKYLSKKALKALSGKPAELAPWDPFGTLAD